MKEKTIQIRNIIFWVVIAIFAAMAVIIASQDRFLGHRLTMFVLASLFIAFGVLAAVLAVITAWVKEAFIRKLFFMVTGASAAGVLIFSILHNLAYALCPKLGWVYWGEGGDEPVFFTLALFVCPALFIIGSIGSIVLLISERLKKKNFSFSFCWSFCIWNWLLKQALKKKAG